MSNEHYKRGNALRPTSGGIGEKNHRSNIPIELGLEHARFRLQLTALERMIR